MYARSARVERLTPAVRSIRVEIGGDCPRGYRTEIEYCNEYKYLYQC